MKDWNVAEREQKIRSSEITDREAYETGRTHRAYGWARSPCGAWTPQQVVAYNLGFDGKPFNTPF